MQAQTAIYTKDRTLMRARAQAGFMPAIRKVRRSSYPLLYSRLGR